MWFAKEKKKKLRVKAVRSLSVSIPKWAPGGEHDEMHSIPSFNPSSSVSVSFF